MSYRLLFVLVFSIVCAAPVSAETVELGASKDNTLYEDFLGRFSNGSGQHFFVGLTGGGLIRRGVVHFDVAAGVPAGATITNATLTLNMSRTTSGVQTQNLHRLLADWGEAGSIASGQEGGGGAALTGDATWLHGFFDTTLWINEGGDFNPTTSAALGVGGTGSYSWTSAQLIADVQDMLDDAANNFGWILIGVEFGGDTAKRYDTKENNSPSARPKLVIEYTLECLGDFNNDMMIDSSDLALLIGQFGTAGPLADINNDGVVNSSDLGLLIGVFGTSCP